jgi:hypothetical protein
MLNEHESGRILAIEARLLELERLSPGDLKDE